MTLQKEKAAKALLFHQACKKTKHGKMEGTGVALTKVIRQTPFE